MSACAECGMPVAPGAFHPYAACLLFKASHDAHMVQENLAFIVDHGAAAERERLRERVEAKHREAEKLVNGLFQTGKTASILYWSESGKDEALREVLAFLVAPAEPEP